MPRVHRLSTVVWFLASAVGIPIRGEDAVKINGLGPHTRKVTTQNAQAQEYFDQGLNLMFAFNHDEAIRSFATAAKLDPTCAMAHWGIAIANGPHINNPVVPPERARRAWDALQEARRHVANGTAIEQGLVDAAGKRYSEEPAEDRRPLDEAYATAMKEVRDRFPQDADVAALCAEALMDLRPWDLWSEAGEPRPETPEVLATLERAMELEPNHPLALHLHIHAVEASPHPEKGIEAADRLRSLCPGLGHLVHMPSHIDVRVGQWDQAARANMLAIAADGDYVQRYKEQGFYRIYIAHNRHMLAFARMMRGQSKRALDGTRDMLAEIPDEWTANRDNAAIVDALHAMPCEIHMRFGQWEALLAEPEPSDRFPIARAIRHAARGAAQAALGETGKAREELARFRSAIEKLPESAFVGNNKAADVLAVAEGLLEGEILLREGKTDEGLAMLRSTVVREDKLRYDEPPDWIIPVRHALGAALLRHGQPAEAEIVYREDLKKWPHNGWSLFGLAQSLEGQGMKDEALRVRAQFAKAWEDADVELKASCFCQVDDR